MAFFGSASCLNLRIPPPNLIFSTLISSSFYDSSDFSSFACCLLHFFSSNFTPRSSIEKVATTTSKCARNLFILKAGISFSSSSQIHIHEMPMSAMVTEEFSMASRAQIVFELFAHSATLLMMMKLIEDTATKPFLTENQTENNFHSLLKTKTSFVSSSRWCTRSLEHVFHLISLQHVPLIHI